MTDKTTHGKQRGECGSQHAAVRKTPVLEFFPAMSFNDP